MSTATTFGVGAVASAVVSLQLDGAFDEGMTVATLGSALFEVLPLAVLVGQAVAIGRFLLALAANPLSWSFLRRHVADPPRFEPGAVPGPPHEVGDLLVANGLVPLVTVSDTRHGGATVFDLYRSPGRLVTAAVGRDTGTVSLVTELSDGRVAHTACEQLLPHEQLVVNTVPQADPAALFESHRALLVRLARHDVGPVESSSRSWLRVAECEVASYRDLGPVVGSLCNLAGTRSLGRLLIGVPVEDVVHLALPVATETGNPVEANSRVHAVGAPIPA